MQNRNWASAGRSRKTKKPGNRELGSKYFGRSVKKWRLIANLSQEDLAQRAGISVILVGTIEEPVVVSRFEEGKTPGMVLGRSERLRSPRSAARSRYGHIPRQEGEGEIAEEGTCMNSDVVEHKPVGAGRSAAFERLLNRAPGSPPYLRSRISAWRPWSSWSTRHGCARLSVGTTAKESKRHAWRVHRSVPGRVIGGPGD